MSDYYPKSSTLPQDVYNRAVWTVRSYHRLKDEMKAILDESPAPPDGMPKGSGFKSDPTESKALRLDEIRGQLDAIESALMTIPEYYRIHVMNNIIHRISFDYCDADRSTCSRWKQKFLVEVAKNCRIS